MEPIQTDIATKVSIFSKIHIPKKIISANIPDSIIFSCGKNSFQNPTIMFIVVTPNRKTLKSLRECHLADDFSHEPQNSHRLHRTILYPL